MGLYLMTSDDRYNPVESLLEVVPGVASNYPGAARDILGSEVRQVSLRPQLDELLLSHCLHSPHQSYLP